MTGPLRIVGSRSAGPSMALQLDERSLARGRRLLDRYKDAPLMDRMQKATLAAARVLEGPIRQGTPVSQDDRPGQMRRSVRARTARMRARYVAGRGWRSERTSEAVVGPRDPKSHLVIRGHRIVTRSGRDTGRRTSPNPYVDVVKDRLFDRAVQEMREHIFDTWRP